MMRSLYSGVAGLKTHQTKIDVIGNNIANVNTTSYKSQSITFSELMYQTTQAASGPNATTGTAGRNAKQIGLGVKGGAISTAIATSGATQTTGNPFDIRITGDSFFVVSNGKDNFFTRDGSFYVDSVGNLAMASNGYNVMGWGVDETTGTIKKDTVQALRIMSPENMTYPPEATTRAYISGIIDKYDEQVSSETGKIIALSFYDNLGYSYTAKLAMKAVEGSDGEYEVSISDVLDPNGKSLRGEPTPPATIGDLPFTFDSAQVDANGVLVRDPTNKNNPVPAGANQPTFRVKYAVDTGKLQSVNGVDVDEKKNPVPMFLKYTGATPNAFDDISIDFTSSSNFNNNGTSTIGGDPGDKDGIGLGRSLGKMSGISIQGDGMIYAAYDNGQTKLLGQMAVAEFTNPSGLQKEGDNLYSATLNSGDFDGIGVDISANGGYMETGVLEMSNVDLSAEFTEMITAQRGFQANSRIISVSDSLLEELVNLKR